jgi:hypothetical protein
MEGKTIIKGAFSPTPDWLEILGPFSQAYKVNYSQRSFLKLQFNSNRAFRCYDFCEKPIA